MINEELNEIILDTNSVENECVCSIDCTEGDFAIAAAFSFEVLTDSDQIGIYVKKDDENYIKISDKYDLGGHVVEAVICKNGMISGAFEEIQFKGMLILRVECTDGKYTLEYADDQDSDYKVIYSDKHEMVGESIGIYAVSLAKCGFHARAKIVELKQK